MILAAIPATEVRLPSAIKRSDHIELSVVVPTLNERRNVEFLIAALSKALADTAWELILVDDNSPDGTWLAAKAAGSRDGRIRCLRRIGRHGLAGACVEGMLSSCAPFVAVMDGDLQHDETILARHAGSLPVRRRSRGRNPAFKNR